MNSTRIPVMTTWNGTDRIDSTSDVYLGRPNTWGQRGANLLVAQSDLLIAVGTRLGMQQTGFNWQSYGLNAFVVHVDIDQAELDKGHPRTDIRLRADADDFLHRLLEVDYPGWEEWLTYAREVLSLLPLDDPENETGEGFVSPYTFYSELSTLATSKDMIIPCSSGGANSVSMQVIAQKRGQVIITDKGLASMGYGLAGAIGAAMAHPGRRTFLVEGDGGFAQNLQELATVAVNNLPIKTFVFANNGYGSIRMTQKNYFGGAYLGCDTETGLGFPEWKTLFGSFGIKCMDIGEGWASDPEVLAALESDEPWGFIVPIDPLQTYWPKITSRITESGSMESNPLHMMSPDLAPELRAKVTRFL
jgi:acetolactate synthase-1/2/3 large subunit